MVNIDILVCLDLLMWLRTGDEVSTRLHLDQSTISRNFKKCCEVFSLDNCWSEGEYSISGDLELLNRERRVHQYHRWESGRPLRIEGMFWSGRTYLSEPIEGLMLGNHDFMSVSQPLSLLRDGIVDAWIAPFPDCPDENDPEFVSIHLMRSPCFLVACESHPIFRFEGKLTLDEVASYPLMAVKDGAFPVLEAYAKKIGLWNSQTGILRYKKEKWEGKTENELTISFSSTFSHEMFACKQRIIPIELNQEFGDVLVVKREYADHPRLSQLKATLMDRLKPWVEKYPEVRLCK